MLRPRLQNLTRRVLGMAYNNSFETPSRPSSASSYSSSSVQGRGSYGGGSRGGYGGGSRGGRGGYGGGNRGGDRQGGYGGGYGGGDRQGGYGGGGGAGSKRGYGDVDSNLMSKDVGTLGLDPTNMPKLVKNFYVEHAEVAAMSNEEVAEFRTKAQMNIKGLDVPKPLKTFAHAGFPAPIQTKLASSGFNEPTPIQAQGWSMALSGQNMVGIAQTGSGKTLSFILPALVHIKGQQPLARGDGPIALVLAPTRELANQIQEVARSFGNYVRVNSTCLYGGAPKSGQIRAINRGCELVIATPGRLLDLLNMGVFTLDRCSYLVLDEADRMLDMGFEQDIRKVLQMIRIDRQVLFWSATWPKEVQRLAHDILGKDFIQVKIGSSELTANKKITQKVIVCEEREKPDHLIRILKETFDAIPEPENKSTEKQMDRTIIFCNKKRTVDHLTQQLYNDYWPVAAIHGDKSQGERDHAIRQLKSGRTAILVATDVAARGLDVKDIELVVNYDLPEGDFENYIHRIGRTARGDSHSGISYALVTRADSAQINDLIKVLKQAEQEIPEQLYGMGKQGGSGRGGGNRYGYGRRGGHGGGGNRGKPSHIRFNPY